MSKTACIVRQTTPVQLVPSVSDQILQEHVALKSAMSKTVRSAIHKKMEMITVSSVSKDISSIPTFNALLITIFLHLLPHVMGYTIVSTVLLITYVPSV